MIGDTGVVGMIGVMMGMKNTDTYRLKIVIILTNLNGKIIANMHLKTNVITRWTPVMPCAENILKKKNAPLDRKNNQDIDAGAFAATAARIISDSLRHELIFSTHKR